MLNFEEEVVTFKFKGNEYSVNKPTNGQIKEYNKALKECLDDDSKEKALILFLESLGLSQEVSDQLTPGQLKKVLENLYESGKN